MTFHTFYNYFCAHKSSSGVFLTVAKLMNYLSDHIVRMKYASHVH